MQVAKPLISLDDGATVDWVLMREEGCSADLWELTPEGPELPRQVWGTVSNFKLGHNLPGL